ncbi:MAG: hypothetical protein IJI52_04720 [Solobacterium sp.]|nr:hypothetical protein [Solobacterium sp.]
MCMYKIDDVVVYRRNVCRVVGQCTSDLTGEDCYILEPYSLQDGSTRMKVPVANKGGHLRDLITREEIDRLIGRFHTIECLENKPANMKSQYAALLKGDEPEELMRIIKTSYLRNKERLESHKKLASIDVEYMRKAEQYLFEEFAVALDTTFDQAKDYFEKQLDKLQ